jgi:hypothetical protein
MRLRPSASTRLTLGLGRLRGIGAEQAIFQGRPVETANDRVHFLGIWRIDKREALGLLRFGIADDLNCVRNEVFGAQPTPDIVRSNPSGQIAQEDGKAHSVIFFNSIGGGLLRGNLPSRH